MKTEKEVKTNVKIGTLILLCAAWAAVSCKDGKVEKGTGDADHQEMKSGDAHQHDGKAVIESTNSGTAEATTKTSPILELYFQVKDALVADNSEKAMQGATAMVAAFDNLELGDYAPDAQEKLKLLIAEGKAHAASITDNPIEIQRKHFKALNTSISEMVAITGTPYTLYEQHCPMYDNGSSWLSASSTIQNPYYGSQMLKCGTVQKEIKS